LSLLGSAALLAPLAGCGGGGGTLPVDGTVKYSDGTVPKGAIAVITFTPDKTNPGPKAQSSSGDIKPDGTFQLRSTVPGLDGTFPGNYKVTLKVLKTYPGTDSLVAKKFDTPDTTTLNAEVKPGQQHFDFVVDKP